MRPWAPASQSSIGRAMAAAAKPGAVLKLHHLSVAGLQQLEIGFVVAVETVVVPAVLAVPHHDVGMLLGNDQVLLRVEAQRRRFALLVAGIAVEVRQVRPSRRPGRHRTGAPSRCRGRTDPPGESPAVARLCPHRLTGRAAASAAEHHDQGRARPRAVQSRRFPPIG